MWTGVSSLLGICYYCVCWCWVEVGHFRMLSVPSLLEQFICVLKFKMSSESDFPVHFLPIALTAFFPSWKSKAVYIVQNDFMQLQSKLITAGDTPFRTKNNSFACSSATTKMHSDASILNTGLLRWNLYIYLIRAHHILFKFPVHTTAPDWPLNTTVSRNVFCSFRGIS